LAERAAGPKGPAASYIFMTVSDKTEFSLACVSTSSQNQEFASQLRAGGYEQINNH
jgi:hypothetical protein